MQAEQQKSGIRVIWISIGLVALFAPLVWAVARLVDTHGGALNLLDLAWTEQAALVALMVVPLFFLRRVLLRPNQEKPASLLQ